MALYGNDFQKLMQAVSSYYGSGSDQWWEVYNYYKLMGGDSATVARILKQTPYVETTVSEAGNILRYSIVEDGSIMSAAETAAAEAAHSLNSNTAMVAVKQASIPANAAVNTITQEVEMTSGATKVAGASAGSKVATAAGHIGTWILGAGVGMKLGVWIDAGLYNLNPDFWDAHNMEYLNPEKWTESKVTNWLYDYSGYDDFVAMFNADDQQLYVDEELFALAAQYLASKGAFDNTRTEVTIDDTSPLFYPTNYNQPIILAKTPIHLLGALGVGDTYFEYLNNTDPVYCAILYNGQDAAPYFWSDGPFDVQMSGMYSSTTAAGIITRNGESFYQWRQFGSFKLPQGTVYNRVTALQNECGWDLAYMMKHGTVHQYTAVEGINEYDQMPVGITDQMTPADIITLLKQQYPNMWDDAIKQGVLNDDGTITDKIYIPIAVPDGGTDGQPTTSPDHPSQVDPDNLTQTQIIVKTVQPTPNPTDQPEPDTGDGNTPAIVPPTGSADALYKIYNPTNAQIQSFGAWLWSSNFVDQLLKVFNDPMQAIISLHKIYASPHIGGTATIKVGYLDSQVPSKWVDQQYIDVDCGTVNVFETSGNVIDYMCDIRIYLPFIGIVSLDVDDVMRGVIGVKYRIDVITGTCVAFVSITRDAGAGGVIYQYTGSMAEVYPLSSGSYMGIITGVLGIAAGIAGTIATGGAAAPALIGGAAGLTAMHAKVEHSNGFSGNAGALAAKIPYIIISRPQSAMSNGIGFNTGWPANYYIKLSQCKGYTRAKALHLAGIEGATDAELQQIETLLKSGVII